MTKVTLTKVKKIYFEDLKSPMSYHNITFTFYLYFYWFMVTFPHLAIRFVSLLLICLSILVSPLEMRTACQMVKAPSATPTVLLQQSTIHFILCMDDKDSNPVLIQLYLYTLLL